MKNERELFMKRFVANLNDGSYVNVAADRMELKENMIFVYCQKEMVAIIDVSCILVARLDDRV